MYIAGLTVNNYRNVRNMKPVQNCTGFILCTFPARVVSEKGNTCTCSSCILSSLFFEYGVSSSLLDVLVLIW